MYVRGQRANFLSTKNSQILYFALVYQHWEVFLCDDLPNGPVLSCLFDFDLQAWIVMARSSSLSLGKMKWVRSMERTRTPRNVRRPKRKTENSKCQEGTLSLERREREHNPEPDSSPPFRLPPFLPPSLPSPRPFPCRAATRYIRPVANLPICQLPGTLGRELWSKWDGEMLIAGHNPPHHCHQGPSLSLSDDRSVWWSWPTMMMMMMSGLFVRNGHPSPIPTMLAPRIEPTAVHMSGLFRKLCERSFGTMEEEDEVGRLGSYWTAGYRLAREGKRKTLRLRLRHFYVYQKVGCDVETYKEIENHYGRRFFLFLYIEIVSTSSSRTFFFLLIYHFFLFLGGRAERRQFPFCRLCVATSKFNMRVNIYAIAYYSGVSYYHL